MGAVMVTVAVLMVVELDIRFQTAIADNLPAALVNPSRELEESAAARERLADLRGGSGGGLAQAAESPRAGERLPVLGTAPEITGTQRWFNTPGGRPLSLDAASRAGRPDRLLDLLVHQLHPHAARTSRPGTSAIARPA